MKRMRLHEKMQPDLGCCEIIRVPGGWIYRFSQYHAIPTGDGGWAENHVIDSVFVPLSAEFGKGGKDA